MSNSVNDFVLQTDPFWASDGTTILYSAGPYESNRGIYQTNIYGSYNNIIFQGEGKSPELSPDRTWMVFEMEGSIFKRKMENDSIVQLTQNGVCQYPTWSKDGNYIAYESNFDSDAMFFIWKMKSDGSDKKRIIYTPEYGGARQPSWFPDGIRLVVVRGVPGRAQEIAIIDTSGNDLAVLTNDNHYDLAPKVSSDGNLILYWRHENWGQVCAMKIDGSEHKVLCDGNSRTPNWSLDDQNIVYTNSTANDGKLWIMSSNGLFKRKIFP